MSEDVNKDFETRRLDLRNGPDSMTQGLEDHTRPVRRLHIILEPLPSVRRSLY